eukprot:7380850-Prymnesium_polylepis.1
MAAATMPWETWPRAFGRLRRRPRGPSDLCVVNLVSRNCASAQPPAIDYKPPRAKSCMQVTDQHTTHGTRGVHPHR